MFEVIQDFDPAARGDKYLLGRVKLNLAEYVDLLGNDRGITRRYLLQDSKINSTLNVSVIMRQIEGEKNYTVYVFSISIPLWTFVDIHLPPFSDHLSVLLWFLAESMVSQVSSYHQNIQIDMVVTHHQIQGITRMYLNYKIYIDEH